MSTANLRDLPLRERKKLRVRQALTDTALRLFTEKGYDATTLDDLCDAVEVSKRTFFRNFPSKEDVALAADSELWSAYLIEVETIDFHASVLTALQGALVTTLTRMDQDWERRFLTARALCDTLPAVQAHSLRYCNDTTQALVDQVGARLSLEGDVRLRLVVEVTVAAWRSAYPGWTATDGTGGRDELIRRLDETFAAVPAAIDLSA